MPVSPVTPQLTAVGFSHLAEAQVGKPYILGAEASPRDPDPPAFDCSELVEWLYARSGTKITDVSLTLPGSTTATGSYNSKLKLPPLLIDVPAGQSSSTLTILVALNGGVAGAQQPTLFIPC